MMIHYINFIIIKLKKINVKSEINKFFKNFKYKK